jgi:hypothetical protein
MKWKYGIRKPIRKAKPPPLDKNMIINRFKVAN